MYNIYTVYNIYIPECKWQDQPCRLELLKPFKN